MGTTRSGGSSCKDRKGPMPTCLQAHSFESGLAREAPEPQGIAMVGDQQIDGIPLSEDRVQNAACQVIFPARPHRHRNIDAGCHDQAKEETCLDQKSLHTGPIEAQAR